VFPLPIDLLEPFRKLTTGGGDPDKPK